MPYPFPGEKKEAMKIDGSALQTVILLPRGFKGEYPKPVSVTDSINVTLDWKDVEESDGVARFKNVTLAKEMVQVYGDIKAFKDADELKAAATFLNFRPVTRDHPSEGIVLDRAQICGFVENATMVEKDLKGDLAITCDLLQTEIQSGARREVSIGFHSTWDPTPGDLDGMHYDGAQRNIFIDHVAVVPNGRCSLNEGCGITVGVIAPDIDTTVIPPVIVPAIPPVIDAVIPPAVPDPLLESKLSSLLTNALAGVTTDIQKILDADRTANKTELDALKVQVKGFSDLLTPKFAVDEGKAEGRKTVNEAYRKAFNA